ncbi:Serine/threonine protein phosphatase 2A 55 kDa regulatory subunit B beta isoform [Striga hermonthica]|uniref:Serine/threonine-protein phosphatase 2A 55 kDa regulatory subunit B n=1 Tax=Striga hermonthica TaxID=68872 RepID=A0A9N7NDD7_STRHE|nr:Serine/threonine protein phosphatase 2A 55 kDa regulatory subunit B beta isoform [Striga hermonthica]
MSLSLGSDSSVSSPDAVEWRFSQAFGDKLPGESIQDADLITALEFDKNGDHLAVGDRGGRVVIFKRDGVNSDWETFLSGDDLRINLWNLEVSNQCFNIIDLKPTNMEDLIEVITAAEFHPFHCNLLAYSSSRGFVRLVDMRQSALCDHNARIFKDEDSQPKSFFTEIIASITDMKFANDGRHILSRDYMNLKLWDMNMDAGPVATFRVHDNLRPKLCDLYNNDAIFDKFECCLAKDRLSFATGSYSNHLRIFSYENGSNDGVTIEASRNTNTKPQIQTTSRPRRSSLSNLARGFYRPGHDSNNLGSTDFSYDFNSKLLNLAWHPTNDLIACATGGTLFMYHA